MIATDEEALICDLAETYRIYDYKSLPVSMVATFSVGLGENSRIKRKMNNMRYSLDTLLLAAITDRLSLLLWAKTEDAAQGRNRPRAILNKLLGEEVNEEMAGFNTPEEFEKERNRIIKRSEK